MNKVSVIGAGNVGSTTARNIANSNYFDQVVLLDIKEGLAEGKSMDIYQSLQYTNNTTKVIGITNDYSKTANSDIIIITSGMPRKPGMTREDLVGVNSRIMRSIVTECHKYSPEAMYVIVSNPMDTMTYHVQNILLNLGKEDVCEKVFGFGGMLDSARFKYNIIVKLNEKFPDAKFSVSDIHDTYVIGGHGDTTMIPIIDNVTIFGHQMDFYFNEEEINDIIDKTMRGGAILTNFLGTSAWEGPAAGIVQLVSALFNNGYNSNIKFPVSTWRDEYKLCIGSLVTLSKNGIKNIYDIENTLSSSFKEKYLSSVEAVRKVNEVLPKE